MPERRKPTAGFWIVVGLAALVGYPLSIGPAMWALSSLHSPRWLGTVIHYVYLPVLMVADRLPESITLPSYLYVSWRVEHDIG
ncbi:MAG: hypothetical protein EXS05_23050 [Planctomycetaceae bacterium]|nr:hypothetical protein [Planctomycetaceae bacterium]